jgi:hypothetical protein
MVYLQFLLLDNAVPGGGHHVAPQSIQRMWDVAKALFSASEVDKQVSCTGVIR